MSGASSLFEDALTITGGFVAIAGIVFMLAILPISYFVKIVLDNRKDKPVVFHRQYLHLMSRSRRKVDEREVAEMIQAGGAIWSPKPGTTVKDSD